MGKEERENNRRHKEKNLVFLIDDLKHRMSYYTSQVEETEKRLSVSQAKLARLRAKRNASSSFIDDEVRNIVKLECRPSSSKPINQPGLIILSDEPNTISSSSTINCGHPSKLELMILPEQPKNLVGASASTPSIGHKRQYSSEPKDIDSRVAKRKLDNTKKHKELIPLIGRSSSRFPIHCYESNLISSKHKRKMRSLALCPVDDDFFVTSGLDGLVNTWQIQSKWSTATLLSSTDCMSLETRKWPEDIAWHPQGHSIFSVYTADSGDSQISILDLNKGQGESKVTFLEDKPHVKGIINCIEFMPWEESSFVTGGSDHGVVFWSEKNNSWKPKTMHGNMHSSAVMGVAGLRHKQIILSVGVDKKIVGYDIQLEKADYKRKTESKCMGVLPNPSDFNLFMVHTGTHGKQLKLFDIRMKQSELHSFGWKQESSEHQSALISQAWSPNGLYLTTGSADPMIHVFDIRYNAHEPTQSIEAHKKRVFKAVWLRSLPLLVSISSDHNIGLHKI